MNEPSIKENALQGGNEPEVLANGENAGQKCLSVSSKVKQRRSRTIPAELLVLFGIVSLLLTALVYVIQEESPDKRAFTEDQLSLFTGHNNSPMYLSILGEVFDVTKGKRIYGGGGYARLLGKDASRVFVTGDYHRDLHDDTGGLSEEDCATLIEWRTFYREYPEYTFKGKLTGRFWDMYGRKRQALIKVEQQAASAIAKRDLAEAADAHLVACGIRWNEASGGAVWCEDGWHPRLLIRQPADGGQPTQRCACYESASWNDNRQVYPGCKPEATECQTDPPGPRRQQQQGNTAVPNVGEHGRWQGSKHGQDAEQRKQQQGDELEEGEKQHSQALHGREQYEKQPQDLPHGERHNHWQDLQQRAHIGDHQQHEQPSMRFEQQEL